MGYLNADGGVSSVALIASAVLFIALSICALFFIWVFHSVI